MTQSLDDNTVIENYGVWYEYQLASLLIGDSEILENLGHSVCSLRDVHKGDRYKDFSQAALNDILQLARDYYESQPDNSSAGTFVWDTLRDWCAILEGRGDIPAGSCDNTYVPAINTLQEAYPEVNRGYITSGLFQKWLKRRRSAQLAATFASRPGISIDTMLDLFETETAKLDNQMSDEVRGSFGHSFTEEASDGLGELIPTPFVQLNQRIGGGIRKGGYTVVAGAMSSGKTAITMQFAAHFAANGYRTVVITTEEPLVSLDLRMISNVCNINYGRIINGWDKAYLSDDERRTIEEKSNQIAPYLLMLDWRRKDPANMRSELSRTLKDLKRKGWMPDVLMFDWIGGLMPEINAGNAAHVRLLMQSCSDYLDKIAKDENIATIGLAQIDPVKAEKKKRIFMSDLAENKKLALKAAFFFGLSSRKEQYEESSTEGANTFIREQTINIDKPRVGTGGYFTVKRQMEFQRFIT
jgi:replicative DNA helicase